MPYIKANRRVELHKCLRPGEEAKGPGELNYILSDIIDDYLIEPIPLRYEAVNDVLGVLACIQQEVYRRIGVPLEDAKRNTHGEVFFSA